MLVRLVVPDVSHQQNHGRVAEIFHESDVRLVSRRRSPVYPRWVLCSCPRIHDSALRHVHQRGSIVVTVPGDNAAGLDVSLRKRNYRP